MMDELDDSDNPTKVGYIISENQSLLNKKYENDVGSPNRVEYDVIQKEIDESTTDNLLYPQMTDPNFSMKIANKKEFSKMGYPYYKTSDAVEFKAKCDTLMESKMMFSPHQMFVRNFLSSSTPYNSLLLFHGLGSGKTLTSIGVAEQYRQDMRNTNGFKSIMVVASPNVQSNFELQLFDENKLTFIDGDGTWTYDGVTNNSFLKQLNPMGIIGLYKKSDRKRLILQIKAIISKSYTFMGYRKFAGYIEKIEAVSMVRGRLKMSLFKKQLESIFNDRMVIIDEIHNIKKVDGLGDSGKRISRSMINVIKHSDNMRLLLLSATPMYNDYKEIIWLLNIMNLNDGRDELYIKDVFDRDGNFNPNGQDILIQKSRGYISFVRGENPYTFPYRIFPNLHTPSNSIINIQYPTKQMNGSPLFERVDTIDLYVTKMGEYQKDGYKRIKDLNMRKIKTIVPEITDVDAKYNYTVMQPLIECLNFVFPNPYDDDDSMRDVIYGVNGIKTVMNFEKSVDKHYKKNYSYKPEVLKKFGRLFSYDEIGKYSGKALDILTHIKKSDGVSIVYSQYIDGGIVPMALALEEMGLKRYTGTPSLFDETHLNENNIKPVDHDFNEKSHGLMKSKQFNQACYAIISGDGLLSPNNKAEIVAATSDINKNGSVIKVIFISKAGSESLDFKFIRNVFIMDPWYNLSRPEQIIGRAVRFRSHRLLEFEKRNTCIYMYCSAPVDDDCETADMYMYRKAQSKAKQIGRVTRVLKEASVDCVLNHEQNGYTQSNIDITINQIISNGNIVDYDVGDKPFSPNCDYMEDCIYTCSNKDEKLKMDISGDTFNEKMSEINTDIIVGIVKELFTKKYIYEKYNLVTDINEQRAFLDEEIDVALEKIANDRTIIVRDKFDRVGYIVNILEYYLYQPREIKDESSGVYERTTRIDTRLPTVKIVVDGDSKFQDVVSEDKSGASTTFHKKYAQLKEYCELDSIASIVLWNEKKENNTLSSDTEWGVEYLGYNVIKERVANFKEDVISVCLLEYLFDRTTLSDKIALLNESYTRHTDKFSSSVTLTDYPYCLYTCIISYCVEVGDENEKYFVFENRGEYAVCALTDDKQMWVEDASLNEYVKTELRNKKEIHIDVFKNKFFEQFVGLMKYRVMTGKTAIPSRMDFKIKAMENKDSHSVWVLSQGKMSNRRLINETLYGSQPGMDSGGVILPDRIPAKPNPPFFNFADKPAKYRDQAITTLMEMTFRYYDRVEYLGKRWFLDPVETIITHRGGTISLMNAK